MDDRGVSVPKKNRQWSKEEDQLILDNLPKDNSSINWKYIESKVMTRSSKQCRERYYNHLKVGIIKERWSEQEDKIIDEMQSKYGNKWVLISKNLHGRPPLAVKNRFFSHILKTRKDSKLEETDESQLKPPTVTEVRSAFVPSEPSNYYVE